MQANTASSGGKKKKKIHALNTSTGLKPAREKGTQRRDPPATFPQVCTELLPRGAFSSNCPLAVPALPICLSLFVHFGEALRAACFCHLKPAPQCLQKQVKLHVCIPHGQGSIAGIQLHQAELGKGKWMREITPARMIGVWE